MEIRFVSSLAPEDEDVVAAALLPALGALLDRLPIAYTLRIETTGAQVFQHSHPGAVIPAPAPTPNGRLGVFRSIAQVAAD
jgi:hypothetical protein